MSEYCGTNRIWFAIVLFGWFWFTGNRRPGTASPRRKPEEMAVETQVLAGHSSSGELVRSIDWKGAFWVASGVPALVLFSIGGMTGTTGKLAFLVWAVSMVKGFVQSFT